MEEKKVSYSELSTELKLRWWIFKIIGAVIMIAGAMFIGKGFYSEVLIAIGTVILIIGLAVWMMASPGSYNSSTDTVAMIAMDRSRKIEEFYEAYKNMQTPLGSAYLVHFRTMKNPAVMFGPDSNGDYIYFWLNKSGNIGYVGYSFLTNMVKEKITEPLFLPKEDFGTNTSEYVCYHSDIMMMQKGVQKSFEHFAKTGIVTTIFEEKPSEVYTFTEDFKLTGQHFELRSDAGELIYEIDGTVPLKKFTIYDAGHTEVFRVEKRLLHALPTYDFYYRGEEYGRLEKKFVLVKDKFTMKVKEGTLTLKEYAGSIGHNFFVTLNGEMLGSIMDDLELSINNIVFDNAVVICYEEKYLPLLTAMSIMVAREIARDEEK